MNPRRSALVLVALALAGCTVPSPSPSVSLADCPRAAPSAEQAPTITANAARAVVKTSLGTFDIELDPEAAPIAVANFVGLARCGFYADVTFHRVIAGFVIQAGDPQTRTQRGAFEGLGSGGPGYGFEVEFPPANRAYEQYVVAMANAMRYDFTTGEILSGADTNGSQFFIDLVSLVGQLRPYYSVLGRVTEGTEVVDAIGRVAVNDRSIGVPLEPVIIESIAIEP